MTIISRALHVGADDTCISYGTAASFAVAHADINARVVSMVSLLSLTLWDLQLVITRDMTGVSAMLLRAHPCVIAGRQVQESCRSSQQVWIKRKEHLQGADLQTEVASEALQSKKR